MKFDSKGMQCEDCKKLLTPNKLVYFEIVGKDIVWRHSTCSAEIMTCNFVKVSPCDDCGHSLNDHYENIFGNIVCERLLCFCTKGKKK